GAGVPGGLSRRSDGLLEPRAHGGADWFGADLASAGTRPWALVSCGAAGAAGLERRVAPAGELAARGGAGLAREPPRLRAGFAADHFAPAVADRRILALFPGGNDRVLLVRHVAVEGRPAR